MDRPEIPLILKAIEREKVTPAMLALFLPAFNGEPGGLVGLAEKIAAGAVVYSAMRGELVAGYFVARVDGVEFEVLAGVGAHGDNILPEVLPMAERLAVDMGLAAVTFETWRGGLMRKSAAMGYRGVSARFWKAVM